MPKHIHFHNALEFAISNTVEGLSALNAEWQNHKADLTDAAENLMYAAELTLAYRDRDLSLAESQERLQKALHDHFQREVVR